MTATEVPFVRSDVVISDGTGTLVLRFVGRSAVPGIDVDRRLVAEGTPGTVEGRLVMLNPLYWFEGADCDSGSSW